MLRDGDQFLLFDLGLPQDRTDKPYWEYEIQAMLIDGLKAAGYVVDSEVWLPPYNKTTGQRHRADIVVYDDLRPCLVIEVKMRDTPIHQSDARIQASWYVEDLGITDFVTICGLAEARSFLRKIA